jgi:hypothetical protein
MKIVAAILSLFAVTAFAGDNSTNSASLLPSEVEHQHEINLKQEPNGNGNSWVITTNDYRVVYHIHNHVSGSNWIVYGAELLPLPLPHTYKDSESGISFYVESDGQRVSAINSDGKILWTKNTLAEPHLAFFRTNNAHINFLRRGEKMNINLWKGKTGEQIAISFTQVNRCILSGILDVKTGDFAYGIECY